MPHFGHTMYRIITTSSSCNSETTYHDIIMAGVKVHDEVHREILRDRSYPITGVSISGYMSQFFRTFIRKLRDNLFNKS